jgi:hypothetical protein
MAVLRRRDVKQRLARFKTKKGFCVFYLSTTPVQRYNHHCGARHLVIQHCRQHFGAVLLVRRIGWCWLGKYLAPALLRKGEAPALDFFIQTPEIFRLPSRPVSWYFIRRSWLLERQVVVVLKA